MRQRIYNPLLRAASHRPDATHKTIFDIHPSSDFFDRDCGRSLPFLPLAEHLA
jgi:hypothetical protein